MISACVCYGGKGRLHFIPDNAKVNSKLYRESLLPKPIEDYKSRLLSALFHIPAGQSACSHGKAGSKLDSANCSDLIVKHEWPPNSPDLNPLDYHVWGAMRKRYKTFQPKPNTIDELKKVLQTIWDDLPQNSSQQGHIDWASSKDVELVWKLGADTLNTFEINCFHRVLNW